MTLHVITLVLDGMPWIASIFTELNRLSINWRWHVIEGACDNKGSTNWCQTQPQRLSVDGTTQFLEGISKHPKVSIYRNAFWPSKDAMVNHALPFIKESCVLMQVDADELWTSGQFQDVVQLFRINHKAQRAAFKCRYFVGPHLAILPEGDPNNKWTRAWRYSPGMRFETHEPPVLAGNKGDLVDQNVTSKMGLTFDHMSWVLESQVAYKVKFYGYGNSGLLGWRRLQQVQKFPVRAASFMPWMPATVMVGRI